MALKTLGNRLQQLKPKLQTGNTWRAGKTSTQRGYGYAWQRARARFLQDNPLCRFCEKLGRVTVAVVVDHIEPHQGDEALFWSRDNWQPLCKRCHDSVKAKQEREARNGQ